MEPRANDYITFILSFTRYNAKTNKDLVYLAGDITMRTINEMLWRYPSFTHKLFVCGKRDGTVTSFSEEPDMYTRDNMYDHPLYKLSFNDIIYNMEYVYKELLLMTTSNIVDFEYRLEKIKHVSAPDTQRYMEPDVSKLLNSYDKLIFTKIINDDIAQYVNAEGLDSGVIHIEIREDIQSFNKRMDELTE